MALRSKPTAMPLWRSRPIVFSSIWTSRSPLGQKQLGIRPSGEGNAGVVPTFAGWRSVAVPVIAFTIVVLVGPRGRAKLAAVRQKKRVESSSAVRPASKGHTGEFPDICRSQNPADGRSRTGPSCPNGDNPFDIKRRRFDISANVIPSAPQSQRPGCHRRPAGIVDHVARVGIGSDAGCKPGCR